MTASVTAAEPFFKMVLCGENDQAVIIHVIVYTFSQLLHIPLTCLLTAGLFPGRPGAPAN